ncbi:hypothetical protein [Ralstonia phage RP31]|uniref:Uncharacterized protein n=2 Tax=Ripduovirus RP12 TaxID=2560700 RepID=A0A1L7N0W4_9CAUD|nr:hypothetical protein FDH28_gp288 [Ralstonia phage RP12]BAW19107.1 hypothetical protein [Ralstonia phage RP12]BAW19393.1 hypothetical protein [Ralstonia phage RP31]
MDVAFKRCIDLIDEVDILVSESATVAMDGNRLVLSRSRTKDGHQSVQFNRKKSQLLGEMRETFIEPATKAVKLSQLITFCHQTGLELVTHHVTPNVRACALVRAPSFDIVIEDTVS